MIFIVLYAMTQTTQNFICCDFSIIILNFNTVQCTLALVWWAVADTSVIYKCQLGNNWNQRGRYSHVVLFWGLLPKVNYYIGASREAYLPILQVFFLLDFLSSFYPCRVLPSGHSPLARPSRTHPWVDSALLYILYKGEYSDLERRASALTLSRHN